MKKWTRNHPSRIQATSLPNVCASWWMSLKMSGGGGLVGGKGTAKHLALISFEYLLQLPKSLYSGIQCIMGNGHMGPHLSVGRMTDWRTDVTENITFLQLPVKLVFHTLHVALSYIVHLPILPMFPLRHRQLSFFIIVYNNIVLYINLAFLCKFVERKFIKVSYELDTATSKNCISRNVLFHER